MNAAFFIEVMAYYVPMLLLRDINTDFQVF